MTTCILIPCPGRPASRTGGSSPEDSQFGERLIVDSFEPASSSEARRLAAEAIRRIGQQGEGWDLPPAQPGQSESHFERFLELYKRFKALSSNGTVRLTWPVTENPNTTSAPDRRPTAVEMMEAIDEAHEAKGRITHPRSRVWAHLFNLRYRMLLTYLSHFLRLNQELYVPAGQRQGDRTARGLLLLWTFDEMRRLKKIAAKLVQMPKDDSPNGIHAGPPFELPYTLNLPDREPDRWRTHLDASRAAARLVREQLQPGEPMDRGDGFLADLLTSDEHAHVIMRSLTAGGRVPEESLPTGFRKVVAALEEAVRGFDIGSHKNFWDRLDRDRFISGTHHPLVPPLINRNPDGSFDDVGSPLMQRLEASTPGTRMPRFRPKLPEARIAFIRQWIQDGCADGDPPGLPGIERERHPTPEPVLPPTPPVQAGPLSFATDIKPLFRDFDRDMMRAISDFDLHAHADVVEWADRILAVLEGGSMPCDGSWPSSQIAVFRRWIADGRRP